ncbi:MAG: hypothetical protein ACPGLV_09895 [Bacteroidia bacterium]
MRVVVFVLSIVLLASCGGNNNGALNPYQSKCKFNKEIKHFTYTNLSKALADSITIENKGVQKNLIISFERNSKLNTIIEKGKGLIFKGTATKYNNFYFLNSKVDSGYQIFVLRHNNDKIQGICDFEKQLKLIDNNIEQGFYQSLVHKNQNGFYVLSTDKKEMTKLYSQILLSIDEWQIMN